MGYCDVFGNILYSILHGVMDSNLGPNHKWEINGYLKVSFDLLCRFFTNQNALLFAAPFPTHDVTPMMCLQQRQDQITPLNAIDMCAICQAGFLTPLI